jgi:hypothetical protein
MQTATDARIFDRAKRERRIIVAADTDLGTLLALSETREPSVILFRRAAQRRPERQVRLLLANLWLSRESSTRGECGSIRGITHAVRRLPSKDRLTMLVPSLAPATRSIPPYQCVRGAVMLEVGVLGGFQFWDYSLGQDLA